MRRAAVVIAGAFALLIAGAAIYLSLVPIDLTPHLPRIKAMIEQRVAGQVQMERMVVKALPHPEVRIEGLGTAMGGAPIFDARLVRLKVSLLPLVIGHVVIEDLELDGARIFIDRDRLGEVNVLKFLKSSREKLAKRRRLLSVSVRLMNIRDTRMEITDRMPEEPVELEVTGIKGLIARTGEGIVMEADARLAPDTVFTFSGKETRDGMQGQGSLRRLRLERFSPYLSGGLEGASVRGTVDFDFTYGGRAQGEVQGTLRYGSLEVSLPGVLKTPLTSDAGSAVVRLAPEGREARLSCEDIAIDMGTFTVAGRFSLTGPKGGKAFSLGLSATPVEMADLMELAPVKALSGAYAERAASVTPVGGTVVLKDFSFSGPVKGAGEALKGLHGVSLDVALKGVGLRYKGLDRPFEGISASITLRDGTLGVAGMTGRYGKGVIRSLDASVKGLLTEASYDASVKADLDVAESIAFATRFMKKNTKTMRTLSRLDSLGVVSVDAAASGELKGGLSASRYSGRAVLKGGRFSLRGSPLKFGVSSTAEFDEKTIEIKALSAKEGHSSLELSGRVSGYRGKGPAFSIKAQGTLSGQTLKRAAAGTPLEKETGFAGTLPYSVKGKGTISSFNGEFKLDGGPAAIRYRNIIDKPAGQRLVLAVSGGRNGDTVEIKSARAAFGAASMVAASGTIATDMKGYDVTVASEALTFSDAGKVFAYLADDFDSGGNVTFEVEAVKKSVGTPTAINGSVDVRDAHFKTPFVASPVEDIDASARFNGNSAQVSLEKLSVGRTRVKGRLEVPDIAGRKISFSLTSQSFYTSDIFVRRKKGGKEAKRPSGAPGRGAPAPEQGPFITGSGTIKAAAGEIFGQPFRDFRAQVVLDPDTARAEPVEMFIDNGRAAGRAVWHRHTSSPVLFDTEFDLAELDTETMLTGFGAKKEYLTGRLNGKIAVSGRRGAEPFTRGLDGAASIRTRKGRMWKIPVIADIFSIVNIISIDELFKKGLPYKTISGDFKMKDGVVSTESVAMSSDSMRMSAVGSLSIPDSKLDIVVALRPFVTIDKIISNIPLAGWIITGKEESTVSMYFGVRGPLEAPSVRPMTVAGISKGVFGILQRIIEAPIEILKGEMPGAREKKEKPREEVRPSP
ncbi:MAG: AsmA-like C-terminal domain-containing protein [Thermodesulfobacteriota bacterium]